MNLDSTAAGWISFLLPWQHNRLVEQLGGEVARECHADLWKCVRPHVMGMDVAETRGYVRARAEEFVVTSVDHVFERRRPNDSLRPRVVALAVEQIIHWVVRDALSDNSPVEARPMAA